MQDKILLYGTEDCHLCELAKAECDTNQVDYTFIDIIDSEQLQAQYATSIPVLDWHGQLHYYPFSIAKIIKDLRSPS
ncbi:hypothetical protein AwWohl_14210 [Gammaproteobacteria bacterium]|nr:hypothetical protein AwWohl_14210 [Gammaproteobacteria bacterium]